MDKNVDLEELQKHLRSHGEWPQLPKQDKIRFLALALAGEAGELANLVKKQWRGDFRRQDPSIYEDFEELIKGELNDICNYAFMLANLLGHDILKGMLEKLIEVEQRSEFKKRDRNEYFFISRSVKD